MKKNLLLILMFITMFFIGSTDTYALKCKLGDKNCATTEEAKDSILKEINSTSGTGRLACMYEVTLLNGDTYFTYIYYNAKNSEIYAGDTNSGNTGELNNKKNPFLLGTAYDNLYNNYQCPAQSYVDTGWSKNICFDDGNIADCKNNNEKLNISADFNDVSLSERTYNNASVIKYKNIGWTNSCDNSMLPSEYQNSNYNVCRYSVQSSSGTKYALLLHNGSNTSLLYNDYTGTRVMISGKGPTQMEERESLDTYINEYTNNISNVKNCPASIYLNLNETKLNNVGGGGQITHATYTRSYSWDSTKKNGAASTQKFTYDSCNSGLEIEESVYASCSDLLIGTDLQEDINDIMTIIRIAVPILLIVLVSYDVFMSVLSGSDDKVKKNRDRIIKRVIIAIAIFFVPTLLNLVFGLVNDIWGTNFDTCGLAHFTE